MPDQIDQKIDQKIDQAPAAAEEELSPEQQVVLQLPMIPLQNVGLEVRNTPDGSAKMLVIGPVVFVMPIAPDAAHELGTELGKPPIPVATALDLAQLPGVEALGRAERRRLERAAKKRR